MDVAVRTHVYFILGDCAHAKRYGSDENYRGVDFRFHMFYPFVIYLNVLEQYLQLGSYRVCVRVPVGYRAVGSAACLGPFVSNLEFEVVAVYVPI